MFYVFHGDDHLTQAEELAALREKMGDPTMAELNTTHLDGRKTTLDELRLQCDTLPFMADRRLIIVEGMLGGTGNSGAEKQLLEDLVEFLPNLPPSTRLVFLEDKPLSRRHPVLSLAQESDTGYAKRFVCPTGTALVRWVKRRAKQEGGEIDDGAAQTLAALVSDDLALLVQEIRKLVTYTGGQRPIAEEDIALLTPHAPGDPGSRRL